MKLLLSLLGELIGPIVKALATAFWEMKEKSHEVVIVDTDPDVRERFSKLKRMRSAP